MYRMKKGLGYKNHPNLLLPLLIGFVVGVIVTNIWIDSAVLQTGFLSEYALNRLKYIEVDGSKLFLYVIQNRFKLVLIILIASSTILGFVCSYLFSVWFGITTGIMISVLTVQFGIKGSLLFLACIFPQVIFYVCGFCRLLQECYIISCKMYFPNRIIDYSTYHKKMNLGQMGKIIGAIGVVIIGIFLESYVNPFFVEKAVIFLKLL